MWRSVGFLMSFAVVMEGMTLITFVVVIAGGKQKRESGWKILTGLLILVALIQCTAMALVVGFSPFPFCVPDDGRDGWHGPSFQHKLTDEGQQAYLYNSDDRFFPGWKLDTSWILCTVSWSMMIVLAGLISSAAVFLPQEGGYELIPDQDR